MDVKPGYKQTAVGVIPEDWDVKPLVEISTEIGDGIHTTPEYVHSSAFFFINGNNLVDGKIAISENTMCINEHEYRRFRKNLNERTILISINGTIGNLATFNGETVVLGKSAAYINILKNIHREYIYYHLMSAATVNYIENELTGTTINNFSLESLRNTPIPVPRTQEEQRAIAAALSDVDALIAALDRLIAKKRDIKQSAMQELLTGKRRLPGFETGKNSYRLTEIGMIPEDWEVRELAEIMEVIDGDRGKNYPSTNEYSENGYCLFLSAENVTRDGFRFQHCSFVTKEKDLSMNKGKLSKLDLVLTTRGTVGNFAVFDDSVLFENIRINSGMVILRNRTDCISPHYLYTFSRSRMMSVQVDKAVFGSAQPQLTVYAINKFRIPLPTIKEQTAIAATLSDMVAEIAALEAKLAKAQRIKQGMMQELLTGRIRLV